MVYVPSAPSGIENWEDLTEYVGQELLAISRELGEMNAVDLRLTHREPVRPRDGMIVAADGADWEPVAGYGESIYAFLSGAWVALLSSEDAATLAWTPALKFGGGSTAMTGTFTGRYIKVGSLVTFALKIVLTAKGSSTGAATITGLPFSAANLDGLVVPSSYANMAGLAPPLIGDVAAAAATINLKTQGAAGTANVTDANFTNTSDLRMAGVLGW